MAEPVRGAVAMAAKPALLIVGLAAAGYTLRGFSPHDFAQQAGGLSLGSFVLLGTIACAIGVPRQVVAFAGGYAHGLWLGGGIAMVSQLLGCAADLVWARLVARSSMQSLLRGRFGARLARLDAFLAAHPFSATLTLRLLPVGSNVLTNLLAGAFGVDGVAFMLASAIGYLPQTAVFVLLGGGVRVAHVTEVAIGIATFAGSTVLGLILLRRARAQGAAL